MCARRSSAFVIELICPGRRLRPSVSPSHADVISRPVPFNIRVRKRSPDCDIGGARSGTRTFDLSPPRTVGAHGRDAIGVTSEVAVWRRLSIERKCAKRGSPAFAEAFAPEVCSSRSGK